MPYIHPDVREVVDEAIGNLDDRLLALSDDLGTLNYVITRLLLMHFNRKRRYIGIVEITGTLVCVLLEFYTRHARKYEDEKISEHGDVTG